MKKYILIASLFLTATLATSQSKISLKINHKLGSNAFAFNDTAYNNLGNKLSINRMEYYLTVVSVTHDGGTVTPIDKVLLINANTTLYDSLTTLTLTTLEKVTLAVGVKPSLNHLDPSLYPASNPLAPKSPSMHWGWTPGYRFVAMEGNTHVNNPSRVFEIHSLGDVSYFYTTISTAGVVTSGETTIELNADYLESIRDIDISNGPLIHGESAINKKNLENFRDHVFTSIEGNPSVGLKSIEKEEVVMTVSPNPLTKSDRVRISLTKQVEEAMLTIVDLKGNTVYKASNTSQLTEIGNLNPGFYICNLSKDGVNIVSRKFVVSH